MEKVSAPGRAPGPSNEEIDKIRAKKEGVERERLVLQEKKEAIRKKLREEYGVEAPAEASRRRSSRTRPSGKVSSKSLPP